MIRPLLAAMIATVALVPAQAGQPVPAPRDIRPVEVRLEPMLGFYPRADRFIPVVAYAEPDDWTGEEPFAGESVWSDGADAGWEGGR